MKYIRVGDHSYPLDDAKILQDGKTVASFKQDGVFVTQQFRQEFQILVGPDDVDDLSPEPERVHVTGVGQVLSHVHDPSACEGHGCAIHHPSDHNMVDLPTLWRADRGLMERVCAHGVGHPDPDHLTWVQVTRGIGAAYTEGQHGCDGCCQRSE